MRKGFYFSLFLVLVLSFFACTTGYRHIDEKNDIKEVSADDGVVIENGDVVVLYTNDIHCGIDRNEKKGQLGYAVLSAYKKEVLGKTPNVVLADIGDAVQGDTIGTVSTGEYLVKIMNQVGYDYNILGNHEFDYGMERLKELIGMSKSEYLVCDMAYTGAKDSMLAKTKPYVIREFNGKKIAFIGIATPESIVKSTPAYFMEGDKFVYSIDSAEKLFAKVQKTVNEVKLKGADIVVAMGHLGIENGSEPNRSYDVIANTAGIDIFLDGHSHDQVAKRLVKNKLGQDVIYSQTGTKFNAIGQLVIKKDGSTNICLVKDYVNSDRETANFIADIKKEYEAAVMAVVARSEVDLLDKENGIRMVRNRETALGDFCADAYRTISGADVAFVNGGGIRAAIAKGDLTLNDMISLHPYGNMLCVVEATGQEILDALELGSMNTTKEQNDGKNALGESGGFLQVSGLRYEIDTSIPSSVKKDENGFFVKVDGPRRITYARILDRETENWEPVDPNKTYTLASHNYKLKNKGDGYSMFADNKLLVDESMIDNQVIITYVRDYLGGVIPASEYSEPQGRIIVK